MPTSDEDLAKEQERVAKLREQVADAEATREGHERDLTNDITMSQLGAEAAQLEARLTVAKAAGKAGAVKEGAAAPLEAVKADMERAVAARDAASAPPAKSTNDEKNGS